MCWCHCFFFKKFFSKMVVVRLVKKAKKSVGKVSRVLLKKGWKGGKKVLKKSAYKTGKMAVRHANSVANTTIRGAGAAASASVGNPAPFIAGEALIKGKDYLMNKGTKALMKKIHKGTSSKALNGKALSSYTTAKPNPQTPRSKKRLGIATQSHAHEAHNFKAPSTDYLNRNSKKFSYQYGKRKKTNNYAGSKFTKHYEEMPDQRNTDHFTSNTRPTGSKL
jgi:hypothetical protein